MGLGHDDLGRVRDGNLILGWFVLVETGSPFLLAVVAALQYGGTLLAPGSEWWRIG